MNFSEKRRVVFSVILSFVLSTVLLFQGKIYWDGNVFCHYSPRLFEDFIAKDIFVWLFISVALSVSFVFLSAHIDKLGSINCKPINIKRSYLYIPAICSFLSFFIYLINYFPGVVLPDSLQSMYQGVSGEPFVNQHPVVYSILVGIIVRFGDFLFNYTLGILLYSLMQMTVLSLVIGYFIYWLAKRNVPMPILVIVWSYYSLTGIFSSYAVTMWKDPLFSCFLLLLMLKLNDLTNSPEQLKKTTVVLSIVSLIWLIAFFRTNGLFIVLILAIIFTFVFYSYKKFIASLWISLVLILLIQGPGYKMLGIVSPLRESIGIPLQQTAYILCEEGNVKEEELEYLDSILPIEKWKETYQPFLVDYLKSDINLDAIEADKIKFYTTWIKISLRNLPLAIQAHAIETYGFWSIGTQCDYGFYENIIVKPNIYNVAQTNKCKEILGLDLRSLYSHISFPDAGTFFIALLLSSYVLIIKKKTTHLLSLCPAWLCWISVMLATPVAFSLRYVFILALGFPYIILLPFMKDSRNE